MSVTADIEFKLLDGNEAEVAAALAGSVAGVDEPGMEVWGVRGDGGVPARAPVWGLYIGGGLAGALWLNITPGGVSEVQALALPRGRWGMGLAQWMLERASAEASAAGSTGVSVRIEAGGDVLGEALEDAGFAGPSVAMEGYPRGDWLKTL